MSAHLSRRAMMAALPAAAFAGSACATVPRRQHPTIGQIVVDGVATDDLIEPGPQIEKLADGFHWSEGPVWIPDGAGYLLFSDVPQNRIHRWSEADGLSTWMDPSGLAGPVPDGFREPGSNGLIRGPAGSILMADCGNRAVARVNLRTQQKTLLATQYQGKRFSSPNDLVLASDGAIYFTDPPYGLSEGDASPMKETSFNGVYRLAPDGTISLIHDGLSRPNGIALSPDQRVLYVANSDPDHAVILRFDLDASGRASNPRELIDVTDLVKEGKPGLPDGLKVADNGILFATGPGGVLLLHPEGRLLGTIDVGGPIANCAFGDDGRTLYMTAGDKLCRVRLQVSGPI